MILNTIYYFFKENYDNALDYSNKAINECKRVGQNYILSKAYNLKAIIYVKNNQKPEAINLLVDWFHTCETLQYKIGMIYTASNLGAIFYLENEKKKAMIYMEMAYSLSESLPFSVKFYPLYGNLLTLYKDIKDMEKYNLIKELCIRHNSKQIEKYISNIETQNTNNIITLLEIEKMNFVY